MREWSELSAVVTGGAGFLGSHVTRKLQDRGCTKLFVPRSTEYDLCDRDAIIRLYEKTRPQIVIHLAATVGGIAANKASPGRYFYDNALMGIQLIEYGRLFGVEKMVVVGTTCSYPKFCPTPFREEDLWNGYPDETTAPYGLAKKMLLVQGQVYRKQYGFQTIHLLPANLFGPGDNFDYATSHVVPALIRRFVETRERGEKKIDLWGDGSQTREFLYVEDAAEGILLATERYDGPEPVNLGTGQETRMKDLAELIGEVTGFEGEFRWDTSKPVGQPRRCLDVSKAREFFGFEATHTLREGIQASVDWFLKHRETASRPRV